MASFNSNIEVKIMDINIDINNPLNCICGHSLTKYDNAYNIYNHGWIIIRCDECGNTIPESQTAWHCDTGENDHHSSGYDLCYACAMGKIGSNHQQSQSDVSIELDVDGEAEMETDLPTQGDEAIDNAAISERIESKSVTAVTNTEITEIEKTEIEKTEIEKTEMQKIFEELSGADSFLKSEEGIDIYQLVAFQSKCKPAMKEIKFFNRSVEYNIYYYNIFKAVVTFFVQIASVFVLLDYAFQTVKKENDKGFCDNSGDAGPKTMAVSYTTFLSLILWSTVQQGRNSGFYRECVGTVMDELENGIFNIVDYTWVTFGRTLCHGVILSAFSLSFLIIFYTRDPMDIILNAVALLFIADIDNMVVTPNDYEDMYQWFKDNRNNWKKYEDKGDKKDGEEGCGWCCDLVCMMVRFFVGPFVKIAVDVFAFCMAVTAPLLIIICY